jgi:hypothetical protein
VWKLQWRTYMAITFHCHVSVAMTNLQESHSPYLLHATIHMSLQVHLQEVGFPWFTLLDELRTNRRLCTPLILPPIYKWKTKLILHWHPRIMSKKYLCDLKRGKMNAPIPDTLATSNPLGYLKHVHTLSIRIPLNQYRQFKDGFNKIGSHTLSSLLPI